MPRVGWNHTLEFDYRQRRTTPPWFGSRKWVTFGRVSWCPHIEAGACLATDHRNAAEMIAFVARVGLRPRPLLPVGKSPHSVPQILVSADRSHDWEGATGAA